MKTRAPHAAYGGTSPEFRHITSSEGVFFRIAASEAKLIAAFAGSCETINASGAAKRALNIEAVINIDGTRYRDCNDAVLVDIIASIGKKRH